MASAKITKTALNLINQGAAKPIENAKSIASKKRLASRTSQPSLTEVSSILMGRVSHHRYNSVVKVAVPKHRLNEFLLLYRRENDDLQVYDEKNICKPGDWVLIRREKEPVSQDVNHRVERIIYPSGNYVDPLTNRRSLGLYYDDDMKKLEAIKIET